MASKQDKKCHTFTVQKSQLTPTPRANLRRVIIRKDVALQFPQLDDLGRARRAEHPSGACNQIRDERGPHRHFLLGALEDRGLHSDAVRVAIIIDAENVFVAVVIDGTRSIGLGIEE